MIRIKESYLKSDPRVKVLTYEGDKKGPQVFIMAGIHGGENSGIQVGFELRGRLKDMKDLKGTVTLIPLVNVDGFVAQTRENPKDRQNINIAGNGLKKQSDKIAEELIDICNRHDYALDLHSGLIVKYLPHTYATRLENIKLGRAFGFSFVIGNRFSEGHRRKKESLKELGTILSRSKPISFCLELGGGMTIDSEDIQHGVNGILSFLSAIEVVGRKFKVTQTPKNQVFNAQRHEVATRIPVPEAGNIFYKVSLGEVVEKGQLLAEITNGYPKVRRIYSPRDGRVVGVCIPARVDEKLIESLGKQPPLVWLMPENNRSLKK